MEGETTGITVKDQDGKNVTGAKVELASSNTNIATVTDTTGGAVDVADAEIAAVAAGTVDITVKVTLADGEVLTSTFKVSVKEAPNEVKSQGFTLVDDITTDAPENTVAFEKGDKETSLFAGTSKDVAMFETLNGDPLTEHADFTGATVRSLNPVIATASVTGGVLTVDANEGQSGKASFEITLDDAKKTKRTISVDVKAESELKDIKADVTSVKLSDEKVGGGTEEGINQKTVTVTSIDQYGDDFAFGTDGKVVVSTNTEGLQLDGGNTPVTLDFNAGVNATDSFTITSTKDKIVNGKVEIKYFKNASDAKPISTKTVTVNVVNIDTDSTPVGLDIVAETEIDVNAPNTSSTADVDEINFGTADVFTLDSNGNRLEKVTATASMVGEDDYVKVDTNVLQFQGNDELTLLTSSDTVDVEVTADGITKTLPIKYLNSASVPASATVSTKAVTVKLDSADDELTFEELIFGAIDADQLVEDEDIDEFIAVKKAAKNGGYLYNQSLVTVKDSAGKVIPSGANVYKLDDTATTGNIWIDEDQTLGFSDETFNVDFSLANVVKTANGDITIADSINNIPVLTDTIDAATAGDAVSFTLVVKSIYVNGASATDNNLLKAPVTINVTVSK